MKKRTKNGHRPATLVKAADVDQPREANWREIQTLLKMVMAGMEIRPEIQIHGETPTASYVIDAIMAERPRVRRVASRVVEPPPCLPPPTDGSRDDAGDAGDEPRRLEQG